MSTSVEFVFKSVNIELRLPDKVLVLKTNYYDVGQVKNIKGELPRYYLCLFLSLVWCFLLTADRGNNNKELPKLTLWS